MRYRVESLDTGLHGGSQRSETPFRPLVTLPVPFVSQHGAGRRCAAER